MGEPAKIFNNVTTHPKLQQAISIDKYSNENIVPYSCDNIVSKISVVNKVTIYPNHSMHLQVPKNLKHCKQVLVEPTGMMNFPTPGIYDVKNGHVIFDNKLNYAVSVDTSNEFCFTNLRKIYDISKQSMKQFECASHNTSSNELCNLDNIKLDPDDILSNEWKTIFKHVLTN